MCVANGNEMSADGAVGGLRLFVVFGHFLLRYANYCVRWLGRSLDAREPTPRLRTTAIHRQSQTSQDHQDRALPVYPDDPVPVAGTSDLDYLLGCCRGAVVVVVAVGLLLLLFRSP